MHLLLIWPVRANGKDVFLFQVIQHGIGSIDDDGGFVELASEIRLEARAVKVDSESFKDDFKTDFLKFLKGQSPFLDSLPENVILLMEHFKYMIVIGSEMKFLKAFLQRLFRIGIEIQKGIINIHKYKFHLFTSRIVFYHTKHGRIKRKKGGIAMCTALYMKNRYFGRNLDYDFSYGERVTIIPRNHPLVLRMNPSLVKHYAFLGMSTIIKNTPLFYDGTNEKGLSVAGLNFVGNTFYEKKAENKTNLCQFEFIPYLLSSFQNVEEVKKALGSIQVTDDAFLPKLPASSLHYMVADKTGACIVIEFLKSGRKVYDNPVGVLTNNPPFSEQLFQLNNYQHLSNQDPENLFLENVPLKNYSRGMGGLGVPGDLSSMSRFVKAVFTRRFSLSEGTPVSDITEFFHVIHSVEQQRGVCQVKPGEYEITIYSSCADMEEGKYYYTTYNNSQINCIDLHKIDLEREDFISYPILDNQTIHYQN